MPCKTCKAADGLVVCLFCGHPFCGAHRSERDGAAACTACQEAEHARSSGRAAVSKAVDSARVAIGSPVADLPGPGVVTAVKVEGVAPPPPLPEAGWLPVLAGGVAGGATGAYLWFFLRWLFSNEVMIEATWPHHAGTALGAALAFGGVWIITKSRLS